MGMLSYCRKARRHQREFVDADRIKHIGNAIVFGRWDVNNARNSAQRFDCFFSQTSGYVESIISALQESYEELDEISLKMAVDDRLKLTRLEEARLHGSTQRLIIRFSLLSSHDSLLSLIDSSKPVSSRGGSYAHDSPSLSSISMLKTSDLNAVPDFHPMHAGKSLWR